MFFSPCKRKRTNYGNTVKVHANFLEYVCGYLVLFLRAQREFVFLIKTNICRTYLIFIATSLSFTQSFILQNQMFHRQIRYELTENKIKIRHS